MRVFTAVAMLGAVTIARGVAAGGGIAQDQTGQAGAARAVKKACTTCHGADQFTSQHRSRDEWAETVDKMIGNGAQVSDADFDVIVNYLVKNFGRKD